MNILAEKFLYPALGGFCGFLYYKFIGCPSGACPITANPYTSTLYGCLIGFALTVGK